MTAPRDPRVAFGLACLNAALFARVGDGRMSIASDLAKVASDLPHDDLRADAVDELTAFALRLRAEPVAAGERLHRWVLETFPPLPPPGFDWQERADLR